MRTPSSPKCRLDLVPPLADRFIAGFPIDYGPVLLLMPFGFHLAMDTLPSGATASGGSRSALAVSGFRLRARLGFSIPANSLRPARHYSRLRIRHSSSEHRRDFNPPERCAAQRTVCPLLTSALRSASLATRSAPIARQQRRSPGVSSAAFAAPLPDIPPWPLMVMDFVMGSPLVRP